MKYAHVTNPMSQKPQAGRFRDQQGEISTIGIPNEQNKGVKHPTWQNNKVIIGLEKQNNNIPHGLQKEAKWA